MRTAPNGSPARRSSAAHATYEPVAVIGMGCRFPKAPDLGTFWQNLRGRLDCITEITADRWNVRSYYDPERGRPGRSDSKWAGLVDHLEEFDAAFFGISSREATSIDPQQRWLIEMVWRALEDGGQPIDLVNGTATGVFVGLTTNDYATLQGTAETTEVDAHFVTGCAPSIAANRISYCLNLKGPSLSIDTACSSSLVAVHLACQALQRGECATAVVAGVNVIVSPLPFIAFASIGMLSPQGRCRTFDAGGDGFVRGEGAGAVLLKPLAAALADGDRIYAVIRGTGVNQDGRTPGMMVPNQHSQEDLVRRVCQSAGIAPSAIRYVEAHGTGTPLGDPIEANALGRALNADGGRTDPCWIGSVKTNIGHLEAGAGIAGLIKVVLALHHGEIPPSLHFERPNPAIDFGALKLRVADELVPLRGDAFAGINSFGWGGTNAHAVLGRAPSVALARPGRLRPRSTLLAVAGRSPAALAAAAEAYANQLAANATTPTTGVEELCRAAARRRTHFEHRLAVVAATPAELAEQLRLAGARPPRPTAKHEPAVAFVFCGQGPQWWGMGRELYRQERVFRAEVDAIAEQVQARSGWSLIDEMRTSQQKSRVGETRFAQPLLFALQSGLAALWRSWGVEPACVLGHSLGEIAAAFVAGALSREDAVRVVCTRAELMAELPPMGRMLAVGLAPDDAARRIADQAGAIWIAAFNSPRSVTLAGDPDLLAQLEAALIRDGIFARFIRGNHAFHCPHMDPIESELRASLAGLAPRPARIPFISTVTGTALDGTALDAEHWWRNVRQPVRFAEAIDAVRLRGEHCHLEIGPHPVMGASIHECLAGANAAVLPSLRRGEPERATLLRTLGELYERGARPHWPAVFPAGNAWQPLPPYPLQRDRFWKEAPRARAMRLAGIPHPLLGQRQATAEPCWEFVADLRVFPYFTDHRVNGHVVFPAAGFLEVALAAAREVFGPGGYGLQDVEILKALFLAPDVKTFVQISVESCDNTFAIRSQARSASGWTTHVTGKMRRLDDEAPVISLRPARHRCGKTGVGAEIYSLMADGGLHHGPAFQGVKRYWFREREVVAQIEMPAEIAREAPRYLIHPAQLDACFQPGFAALPANAFGGDVGTVLPVRVDRLNFYSSPPPSGWVHGAIHEMERRRCMGDMRMLDRGGRVHVEVLGLRHVFLEAGNPALHDVFYELTWRPKPLPSGSPQSASKEVGLALRAGLSADSILQPADENEDESQAASEKRPHPIPTARAHDAAVAAEQRDDGRLDAVAAAIIKLACRDRGGIDARNRARCDVLLARAREVSGRHLSAKTIERGWSELLREMPSRAAEVLLLQRAHGSLATGRRAPKGSREPAFSAGTAEFWDQIYSDAPLFKAANDRIRGIVMAALRATPVGQRLRILEINGGTGALARRVLPYVNLEGIDYVFTDPNPECARDFERRLGELGGVRAAAFDPRGPVTPDSVLGPHDIVIAAPAGPPLDRALATRVRTLLAPGGYLIASDFRARPLWLQLLETLTGRAAASEKRVTTALTAAGFGECRAAPPLIVARAPRGSAGDLVHSTPAGATSRRWFLVSAPTALARELAGALRRRGDRVETFTSPAGGEANLEQAWTDFARGTGPRGIIHLQITDAQATTGWTAAALMQAQEGSAFALLDIAQQATSGETTEATPIFVVTRGAQPVEAAEVPNLAAAPAIGLFRVIQNEVPRLGGRMIDLDPAGGAGEVEQLAAELQADDQEQEIAWRGATRYAQRFERRSLRRWDAARVMARPADNLRLAIARPGLLDQLVLQPAPKAKLGDEDVRIRIEAAGLNFRDVMKALGIYPGAEDPPLFGDECAGIVTEVGRKVPRLRPGDAVFALARGSLATEVVADFRLVFRKPPQLSFEAAATLPVAYLTAYYALHTLGRLQAGERVLIHAAAGGVGLAAVRLAQAAGAEIFATAGSPAKREFLRTCGVRHVFDSRSLKFADQIRAITGARGLDVVLNSLAGEAVACGLGLLGTGGRFLEVGRRDIYLNRRMELRPFANNLAYFAVDLGQLLHRDRVHLVAETLRRLQKHRMAPLPYRAFPLSDASAAFAHMSQARQIGKIVLCPRAAPLVAAARAPAARLEFKRHATYLVTGGLDGFGAVVAKSLALKGACHVVLMARRGITTPGARELLATLRRSGARPVAMRGDVSSITDVRRVLRHIRQKLPPLRGIIHAAGMIDDGLIPDLDRSRFRTVMASKVTGAWLLHEHTLQHRLDFFVLFSSAAAILGSAGQGNYAAANAFLDALAHYRRAQGLPAVTINWGMLNDVGFVARSPRLQQLFSRLGWSGFTSRQAIQALAQIIPAAPVQVTAAKIDWSTIGQRLGPLPRYGALFAGGISATAGRQQDAGWIREQLNDCPPAQAQTLLEQFLVVEVSRALRATPAEISATKPLTELGLDSLMIVELVTRIERQLSTAIPSGKLVGSSTIARLAEAMLQVLRPAAAAAVPIAPTAPVSLAWVDDARLDPTLSFTAPAADAARLASPRQVFLTSCADFLSVFLLRDLLANSAAKIECLARVEDTETLRRGLAAEFRKFGLRGDLSRVHLVRGDLDAPRFGLSIRDFAALAASVDVIFHTGALVNHLSAYARLKAANVGSIGSVLALATETRRKPVHYVSSVSLLSADNASAPVGENSALDQPERLLGGYAQSRWVAEKLLGAARTAGLTVNIYRPGLLVGPVNSGEPGPEHFVWSMLKQCLQLGCAPNTAVRTWLTPVDFVSRSIVRLASAPNAANRTFHLINPQGGSVLELVHAAQSLGYSIRLTEAHDWEAQLVAASRNAGANRILPYYLVIPRDGRIEFHDLPDLDCRWSLAMVGELGVTCPALDLSALHRYFRAMIASGFMPPPARNTSPGKPDPVVARSPETQ